VTAKPKPVLGVDDLLLLLTHHWARDTSTFPTERHRVQFALILLLLAYTGCRPAELVDAARKRTPDSDLDDDDDDTMIDAESACQRCKALCYEDISLLVVRNPEPGKRDVFAMEVTLSHHKGVDRKPKP
jgi:hypothetical protein